MPPHWMIYFRVPDINAGDRAHQGERRQDPQRSDGSARRRLDRERDGSAGRGVRAAREEGVSDGLRQNVSGGPTFTIP